MSAQQCWRLLKPFLPFLLISGLVAALFVVLHAIVYGGPFTDKNFFDKFDRRWPRPLAFNHTGKI